MTRRGNPFDPSRAGDETRAAIAGMWRLETGYYPRTHLAEAMSAATGLTSKWFEGVLRWIGNHEQLPQVYRTLNGHPRAILLISPAWLDAAFDGWRPVEGEGATLAVKPIDISAASA